MDCIFVVEAIEYECGWGHRPDGFFGFADESMADTWIAEKYKSRTGPTPYIYTNYEKIGFKPADSFFCQRIKLNGYVYFDRLHDLTKITFPT
jgi:hypothetical protein